MAFRGHAHHRSGQRRAEQNAVEAGCERNGSPEADHLLQQAALAVRAAHRGPRFGGTGGFRACRRSARVRHVSRSRKSSAMSARYTLHGIFASGPTYKVGLMLALAGEPFDYVHVALREGEHKTPAYLAKQRFGQVPLLVDNSNGRHLCQSAAILEYLADKTGKFGGATLQERMDAREWVFWEFDRLSKGIYRPRAAKLGFAQFS